MASRASLRLAADAIITRRPATFTRSYATTTHIAPGTKVTISISTDAAAAPAVETKSPAPKKQSTTKERIDGYAPYMVATYSRPEVIFNRGEGSCLFDINKKRYIDFTAGIAVMSLGHNNADLQHTLFQQSKQLIHCSNLYHNHFTGHLSKRLVETTKKLGGMHDAASVFICNSGSEANEAGIKFARKVGKVLDPTGEKIEIVSFRNAFHGRTMGSLSATHNPKYQEPFAPMVPGFKVGDLNDIGALEGLITEKTCSVIVEPIQGEGGVTPATDEFLIALAKRCREVGALVHYDEIQCGLSRTGQLWAHSHLPKEAHPDILTTAKALGNGLPIGATIVNAHVAEKIKIGDHGTTFGGNPLVCAVAGRAVYHLSRDNLMTGVLARSKVFTERFELFKSRYPELVSGWRGKGLILGLQLTEDPAKIVAECRERGLLVITAGVNTLRFVPPLNIPFGLINEGLEILEEAIKATRGKGEEVKAETTATEETKAEEAEAEEVKQE
ncbi:putative mitochondrial acetylornithine aminotransferase precursor [Podospora australis]|uniref:acetylornithine transaminase n=1 Tax=Podospora australis TaxID=1536484 RepID=A0AAN7AEZ8_9PEZI|nr:putative mitochondrial acetylornithine aminotransferase precursor [Podospora australis]